MSLFDETFLFLYNKFIIKVVTKNFNQLPTLDQRKGRKKTNTANKQLVK